MTPIADLSKTIDFSVVKGKTAIVTGGASGLGALIATSLADHGAQVTIADNNQKLTKEFIAALKTRGLRLNHVLTDVTNWHSQVGVFKNAIVCSDRQAVDIVVAAAGVGDREFVAPDEDPPSLKKDPPFPQHTSLVLDVNAKGVYYTCKLAQHYFGLPPSSQVQQAPAYRKCLVVISSMAGYLELNMAGYTAAKWAVRGLFRSTRSKMEDLGYRMNLIAPWVMDTPMSKGLADLCRQKGWKVGNTDDVTKAVMRCATDDSICGRALAIGATETFDLRDDLEGLNAGIKMKEFLEGEGKAFMEFYGQRV